MKKTEPIIPALSDEEIRESVLDELENKIDITEEESEPIKQIEDMKDPNPPLPDPNDNIIDLPVEERLTTKNTVRIMDGNFPF